MMLTHLLRRPVAAAVAVTLVATLACREGTGPSRQPALAQYDLVFDGEDALGRRQLYRASLHGAAPSLIGGGIEGIKPSPSPDGTRIAFHTMETYDRASRLGVVESVTGLQAWIEAPKRPTAN
jgi:hypothetical protein